MNILQDNAKMLNLQHTTIYEAISLTAEHQQMNKFKNRIKTIKSLQTNSKYVKVQKCSHVNELFHVF